MAGFNIRRVLIAWILFFSLESVMAQEKSIRIPTGIYFTHNEYAQHKITPMDEIVRWVDSLETCFIFFEKGGKIQRFDCSKIWGFQYKYKIFRCDQARKLPARVISAGKIVYYENGFAHLEMLKYDSDEGNYSAGFYCYLSNNLLSDIIPMPAVFKSELYEEVEKYKRRNKQYKKLFTCIESNYNTSKIRDCVKKFEQGN